MLALAGIVGAASNPITASNDSMRTGWYPDQPKLSPAKVSGGEFGQIFETAVQGQVYAQPLVADGILLVVTEDDWIYGLDPATGAVKWSRNVGTPFLASEIAGCTDLVPNIGITGTPVIDPDTGIAYFYAKTYSALPKEAIWQLHAVSMATGAEQAGFPVTISGSAENINHPDLQRQTAAATPGAPADERGRLRRLRQSLRQPALPGMAGRRHDRRRSEDEMGDRPRRDGDLAGRRRPRLRRPGTDPLRHRQLLRPDPAGQRPPPSDLGEAVARVQIGSTGAATATDFFSPFNREELDEHDLDLGSSAPTALPSQYFGTPATPNLMLVGGKEHTIFVLDRDDLGGQGQGPGGKNEILQQIANANAVFGSMAVWPGQGGYVYIPGWGIRAAWSPPVQPAGDSRSSN